MSAALFITALLIAATVRDIVQTVREHVKAKDEIKRLTAQKEAEEAIRRAAELWKAAKEAEKLLEEEKQKTAQTFSQMTDEQLAAYNRELDTLRLHMMAQYVSVSYVPVYQPVYQPIFDHTRYPFLFR